MHAPLTLIQLISVQTMQNLVPILALRPAKVAKFLAARPVVNRDYLELREQLFSGETVDSLAAKIRAFERGEAKP